MRTALISLALCLLTAPVSAGEREVRIALPAQGLERTLLQLADQTGERIVFASQTVEAWQAPVLKGRMEISEALDKALKGLPLSWRRAADGTLLIERTTNEASRPDVQIPRVVVTTDEPDNPFLLPDALSVRSAAEYPSELPRSVSTLNAALLKSMGLQGLGEAIVLAPGVSFTPVDGNRDTAVIRGVSTSSDFYVDGVRDNGAYFRDLYNLDQVEILRGPGAFLLGYAAAGGGVNRVTRWADGNIRRELTLEGTGWGGLRSRFDWSEDGTVPVRVTGVYEDSDTYRDHAFLRRRGLNPTTRIQAGPVTLKLGAEVFRDERTDDRGIPTLGLQAVTDDPHAFFGNPVVNLSDNRLTSGFIEAAYIAGDWDVSHTARYVTYSKDYQGVFARGVVASPGGLNLSLTGYRHANERDVFSLANDATRDIEVAGMTHQLGLDLKFFAETSRTKRDRARFANGTSSQTVPYANADVPVAVDYVHQTGDADNRYRATLLSLGVRDYVTRGAITVFGAVRLSHLETRFTDLASGQRTLTRTDIWSPEAGVVYRFSDAVSAHATVSQGFVPRTGDLLVAGTAARLMAEPEFTHNREIGIGWEGGPAWRLSASLFRLERRNILVADATDATLYQLAGRQVSEGLEMSLSGNLASRLTYRAALTAQKAVLTSDQGPTIRAGARLANVPKQNAHLWVRYEVTPDIWLAGTVVAQSARFAASTNTVAMKGYSRFDLAAGWRLTSRLNAQVNIENVLNTRYWLYAQGDTGLVPGAPRYARLALTARF